MTILNIMSYFYHLLFILLFKNTVFSFILCIWNTCSQSRMEQMALQVDRTMETHFLWYQLQFQNLRLFLKLFFRDDIFKFSLFYFGDLFWVFKNRFFFVCFYVLCLCVSMRVCFIGLSTLLGYKVFLNGYHWFLCVLFWDFFVFGTGKV